MTVSTVASALLKLEKALTNTSLTTPRPVADLGLTTAQKQHIEASFNLSEQRIRPAGVLIPIQLTDQEPFIILTQRSEEMRHHPGQISFPGGSREDDDADLAHTALRESEEEIALSPETVRVIGYLPDYPTITGFRVTPVVGFVTAQATVEADGREVTQIHRLPFSRLLDGEGFVKKSIEHEGVKLPFFEIHHGDLRIWGATAGMLFLLRKLLI